MTCYMSYIPTSGPMKSKIYFCNWEAKQYGSIENSSGYDNIATCSIRILFLQISNSTNWIIDSVSGSIWGQRHRETWGLLKHLTTPYEVSVKICLVIVFLITDSPLYKWHSLKNGCQSWLNSELTACVAKAERDRAVTACYMWKHVNM